MILWLWAGSNFSMYGAGRQHFTPPDAHTPGFQGFQGRNFITPPNWIKKKIILMNFWVKSSKKEETSNFDPKILRNFIIHKNKYYCIVLF